MPNYSFKCKSCENIFEITRSINDSYLVKCGICDSEAERCFSNNSLLIKGSGFYQNSVVR